MNQYAEFFTEFFTELWESDTPRFALIDGVQVRILIGRINNDYSQSYGVSITGDSREITLVKSELPETWKPKPQSRLTINDRDYLIYKDIPPQSMDPDNTLVKIIIHPA